MPKIQSKREAVFALIVICSSHFPWFKAWGKFIFPFFRFVSHPLSPKWQFCLWLCQFRQVWAFKREMLVCEHDISGSFKDSQLVQFSWKCNTFGVFNRLNMVIRAWNANQRHIISVSEMLIKGISYLYVFRRVDASLIYMYVTPQRYRVQSFELYRNLRSSGFRLELISFQTCVQWWFVNLGSNSTEISLVRIKSVGTDFHVWTNGYFSINPEISTWYKLVRINKSSLYLEILNHTKRKPSFEDSKWNLILPDSGSSNTVKHLLFMWTLFSRKGVHMVYILNRPLFSAI